MKKDASIIATLTLIGVTLLSGLILASSKASAEDSATTNASVTVPVACSMAGHTDTAHNASLIPGTYSGASGSEYEQGIGKTTLTTFCNDNNGFSIYAIGFTGDSYDGENHTKLVGTTASGNATIPTKVYESSDTTSNWSMKVTKVDDSTQSYNPANMSITNSFNNWHIVPDTYTKVAEYHATTGSSTTDTTLGAKVETTYATYISTTQPADTYTGKVKYTLVHPNTAPAPSNTPTLISTVTCTTQVPGAAYMQDINASNKATILAGMTEDAEYFLRDARDNKDYCVAKLRDGNLWMTQNLDHDIDSTRTYTSQDTDIPANWTPLASTRATNDTEWNEYYDEETNPDGGDEYHAESYDPGDLYWSGTPDDSTPVSTGNSHYHLGNYYNWTAAIAVNDSSSYGLYNDETGEYENLEANQSICPAGWTLPKDGDGNNSNGSFQYLLTQYGYNDDSYDIFIWNSPIKLALTGSYWDGSLESIGEYGYNWSSVLYNIEDVFGLITSTYGGIAPSAQIYRPTGISIRCLAR